MRKFLTVIMLLLVSVFAFANFTADAAQLPEGQPALGTVDPASDFYSHWQQPNHGGVRTGDTSVVMALTSGFGMRAGMRSPFNITDFEMSLDLSYVDPGVIITTFFGPQGSYISGNGATLSIEFLPHTTEAHKYLVAINNGSGLHHVSFEEIVDAEQGLWEDAAWVGYQVVAEDDVITVSLKDEGENSKITINGHEFTIATSKLYKDVPNKEETYWLIGAFNKDGTIQTVTANYVLDAARRANYAENGTYTIFKAKLAELETALEEDLSVADNVTAAQTIRDTMDESELFTYDQEYLKARYEAAYATLDAAVAELGGDIVIDAFRKEVEKLEVAAPAVFNLATANAALALVTSATNKLAAIDEETLTEEQVSTLNALKARFATASELADTKILDLVNGQVNAFLTALEDLSTIEKVNTAIQLRNAISAQLIALLPEPEKTTVEGDLADADEALVEATDEINENWTVLDGSYAVVTENSLSATLLGGGLNGDNGIFYSKEKLDVRNFKMTMNFSKMSDAAGSWFSFGLMEKTEIFSNADDPSVQENKGLFFLIINNGNGTARVEVYQLSLYSNRFFDAQKTETLTINIEEAIEVVFGTEIKSVAGVDEEYMSISIGGQKMQHDLITTRAMKTSLEDYQGYLYLAGQGGSPEKPFTVTVTDINGKNPTADSLKVAYTPEPFSSETEEEYELGSNEDVKVNVDTRGLDITSVTLDGTQLGTDDYSYASKVLTIKALVLEKFAEGEKELVVTTDGGSVTVTLTISEATTEPTPEQKGLSTGAIIAIIAGGVAVLAAVGGFVLFKKKH